MCVDNLYEFMVCIYSKSVGSRRCHRSLWYTYNENLRLKKNDIYIPYTTIDNVMPAATKPKARDRTKKMEVGRQRRRRE
jgi:hypothetical protein